MNLEDTNRMLETANNNLNEKFNKLNAAGDKKRHWCVISNKAKVNRKNFK